ncbi:hypothetical protein K469DRAFT_711775 [Zopfia rhizophila CBS 207.26]|uniref:Zn(2)-C6 fungal-type domain-containing protein n=1 Tax=Zopfia rhizophila CBS 207.26 TaxID=1314779 RepID=A0A6A6DXB4_9PEZI|nr:hypothetical protein K469DRAFT_711775 [Zopfia rhizophila CBS 207.26]
MHSTSLTYPPNPKALSEPPHLQHLRHPTPQVPYPVQALVQAEQHFDRQTFLQTLPLDHQRGPLAALGGGGGQNQPRPAGHSWHYPASPFNGIVSSSHHTTNLHGYAPSPVSHSHQVLPNAQRKLGRAAQACDECRRRKQKCDEQKPCAFCKEQNTECFYRKVPPLKTDRTMARIIEKLEGIERRLERIETRLHIGDTPENSATQSAGTPDTVVPSDDDDMCMGHVDDYKPSPGSPSPCSVTEKCEQTNALDDYFTSDWNPHNQEMSYTNSQWFEQGGDLECMQGGT